MSAFVLQDSSVYSDGEALGGRYISAEVLRKIRSYGMTLAYVDGKMVDQSEQVPLQPIKKPVKPS